MIPMNILVLLFIFIIIYVLGLLLTIISLVNSIKNKRPIAILVSVIVLLVYLAFCVTLII